MDEPVLYGQVALGTRVGEARESHGDVAIVVEIKPEDGEERAEAGGRELRGVRMSADEAREFAMKLLAAAGPSTDELVRTWIAGQVRMTIEAPAGNEEVCDPMISVNVENETAFYRVVEVFGGLTAFDDLSDRETTLPSLSMSVPALGEETVGSLYVMVRFPSDMRGTPRVLPPAVLGVGHKQAEQKGQQREEQEAADRIAGEQPEPFETEDTLRGGLAG